MNASQAEMVDSSSTEWPSVSVIIPVYNDRSGLSRCLDVLEKQTYASDRYEVVVVDNNSDQPIDALVARYDHATAASEEKQGSYAARNRGLEVASGEVIAFTDADCIPQSDWLKEGVFALCGLDGKGLVGGRVEFLFHDPNRKRAFELVEENLFLNQEASVRRRNFAVTANMLTSSEMFEVVGPFNDELRSGGDMEWGQRAYRRGFEIAYAPEACVRHPTRKNAEAFRKKIRRVTQGQHDFRKQRGKGIGALVRNVLNLMVPPIRTILKMIADSRASIFVRIRAILLLLRIRATRMLEKVWLELQDSVHSRYGSSEEKREIKT
jgi:glycosyltransferase involved in cell wall biosynthesis